METWNHGHNENSVNVESRAVINHNRNVVLATFFERAGGSEDAVGSLRFTVLGIGILVTAPAALAGVQGVAFAVVNTGNSTGIAELNRLNLDTGELTPVGSVGFPASQIAFDSAGALFGVSSAHGQLLAIDPMTGSGSSVGSFGIQLFNIKGFAFGSDGRLWVAAHDAASGPSLFEIDPHTGAASWRFPLPEEHFGALAATDGVLYTAFDSLATLDPDTGVVTQVSSSSFGIWWARALDFDDVGALWGLMLCGPCMAPYDVLITSSIDPTTGALADDGSSEPHGTWGLAILRDAVFLDGFETGDLASWSAHPAVTGVATPVDR